MSEKQKGLRELKELLELMSETAKLADLTKGSLTELNNTKECLIFLLKCIIKIASKYPYIVREALSDEELARLSRGGRP